MMLKLKLQFFGHLMQRVDSLEKTLMLGGIGGRRRRGRQMMRQVDGITDSMDLNLSELREMVMDREAWRAVIHGVTKSRTWLSDWTELNWTPQIQDQMTSQMNFTIHLENKILCPSENSPKNSRGRNISEFILGGYHHSDTKTRKITHKIQKYRPV